MRIVRTFCAFMVLLPACALGQTMIITTAPKDPEVKPEQLTAAILHYEKMRTTAREVIHDLAFDLRASDGSSKVKLNDAINYQQDIVEWANWCILALRDKTVQAKACVIKTDLR